MVRKCSFSFRDEEVPRDFRWDRQVWLPDDDPLEFSEASKPGKKWGEEGVFEVGLRSCRDSSGKPSTINELQRPV